MKVTQKNIYKLASEGRTEVLHEVLEKKLKNDQARKLEKILNRPRTFSATKEMKKEANRQAHLTRLRNQR